MLIWWLPSHEPPRGGPEGVERGSIGQYARGTNVQNAGVTNGVNTQDSQGVRRGSREGPEGPEGVQRGSRGGPEGFATSASSKYLTTDCLTHENFDSKYTVAFIRAPPQQRQLVLLLRGGVLAGGARLVLPLPPATQRGRLAGACHLDGTGRLAGEGSLSLQRFLELRPRRARRLLRLRPSDRWGRQATAVGSAGTASHGRRIDGTASRGRRIRGDGRTVSRDRWIDGDGERTWATAARRPAVSLCAASAAAFAAAASLSASARRSPSVCGHTIITPPHRSTVQNESLIWSANTQHAVTPASRRVCRMPRCCY
eukprot:476051-Prorocentrum_minimum.AAC.3